jgi:hypothetical protein
MKPILVGALCAIAGCEGCGTHTRAANQSVSIDSQLPECNRGTCKLKIPAGSFSFSTEVNPSVIIHIAGAGASYDNPGTPTPAFPFVEPHCITTLTWTGGNRPPFLFNSYHVQGSKLEGFCLNAVGTSPPVFIDVDDFAGDIQLNDIIIDKPTVKATIAAIRYGNKGVVVGPKCADVFVRSAAPIGFDVLNVQAHFMGERCRAVWNDQNEWVVGDSAHLAESFHCHLCTAEARPGNIPVVIRNVRGFSWADSYTEGFIAFDIPSDAVSAEQVSISNSFASGSDKSGVAAFVRTALPAATLTLSGNEILGATPSYIVVEDDSLASATVIGNTMPSAMVAKNGNKVCALGNVATPAPAKPAAGVCN